MKTLYEFARERFHTMTLKKLRTAFRRAVKRPPTLTSDLAIRTLRSDFREIRPRQRDPWRC